MILYRGTPVPETRPKTRSFECIYFATTFKYSAYYSVGEAVAKGKKSVYVQKYRVKGHRLFDFKHKPGKWKVWFEEPTREFVLRLSRKGYTGMRYNEEVCLFSAHGLKLLGRWRISMGRMGEGITTEKVK